MSAALEELDRIVNEDNPAIRRGLYRRWKSHAIARVSTTHTYDRMLIIRSGEAEVMKIAHKDAVMKLASIIAGESALSYMQMPCVDMDAVKVLFRCDVLKEIP